MPVSIIIIIVCIFAVFYAISSYNGLVVQRNLFRNAFAQIDVQLKRRYDLIPNLVETVKGYMKHEQDTLEKVIAARNSAYSSQQKLSADPSNSGEMKKLMAAEGQLQGSLGRLLAVSESYPELRSSENMNRLQEELASTENKISFARQAYNDAVTVYNTACERFPQSLFAAAFGFRNGEFWEITNAAERDAVKVTF
ncbi:MAG: LemA family protein [Bdellovibrionota bacterium]